MGLYELLEGCTQAENRDLLSKSDLSDGLSATFFTETKMETFQVIAEVADERKRQDEKWGGPVHDDQHRLETFVQLIEDYAGWARVMAGMNSPEKARRRLVQVAALAVAAVESIDRKEEQRKRMIASMR